MNISVRQYYWLILSGLILGLVGGIVGNVYSEELNGSQLLLAGFLIIVVLHGCCYVAVLMEIWARWRWSAVGVAVLCLVLANSIHPAFFVVPALGPLAYWICRATNLPHGKRSG